MFIICVNLEILRHLHSILFAYALPSKNCHLAFPHYLAPVKLETDLARIAKAELEKERENLHFKEVLQNSDAAVIDEVVQKLNIEITTQVDCTACGNCCKTLMINVTQPEADNLALHLQIPESELKEKYIETSLTGDRMIVNAIPCHFLTGTRCSIYEHRFAGCREFPGMHLPGFTSRLFTTFMHYGRCPIIYNVVEELKIKTGFINLL